MFSGGFSLYPPSASTAERRQHVEFVAVTPHVLASHELVRWSRVHESQGSVLLGRPLLLILLLELTGEKTHGLPIVNKVNN